MIQPTALDLDVLRFATAGSVDDGKSSLIGRLLYDSKSIFEDQFAAVKKSSLARGSDQIELALLTDGLRAEREQNITIDVAYRYFSTPKRKFIIGDTPGHTQYTRNMATGASSVDVAIILVDARKGVLAQSKRHAAISVMFGIKQLVLAVNKMDLVEFHEAVFDQICQDFRALTGKLGLEHFTPIPMSALHGDNVVEGSTHMPWYQGPNLLEFLENVQVDRKLSGTLRLPIQYVIRPGHTYRGFAGQVEAGSITTGDVVLALPASQTSRVKSIRNPDGITQTAGPGEAVVVELEDEIDLGRGAYLVAPQAPPTTSELFEASLCWFGETPLIKGTRLIVALGPTRVQAVIESIQGIIDLETVEDKAATALAMNDVGRVVIRTSKPLPLDRFSEIKAMGAFVLIDPGTYVTVAAGTVIEERGALSEVWSRTESLIALKGLGAERAATQLAILLRKTHAAVVHLSSVDVPHLLDVVAEKVCAQGVMVVTSDETSDALTAFSDALEIALDSASIESVVDSVLNYLSGPDFVI